MPAMPVVRYRSHVSVECIVPTTTHGRYLVDIAHGEGPRPLLVGFHGYSENADVQMERLRSVRADAGWSLVSIQALHRFYRAGTNDQIAASWMTRQDRELMIADNVAYGNAVIDAICREFHEVSAIVHAGFSQGASMAYRAAALGQRPSAGVIALGGDVPPELSQEVLGRVGKALIGWGRRDRFYGVEKKNSDEHRLRSAGVAVQVVELDASHKWTEPFTAACSAWLREYA